MKKMIICAVAVILLAGCIEYPDSDTFIWTFTDPIIDVNGDPWKDFSVSGEMMNTNAIVKSYMTIFAGVSNDTRIRWLPKAPAPYEGFTRGAIEVNGRASPPEGFMQIGFIQGPFEITLKYTGIGSGNKRLYLRINNDDVPQINGEDSTGILDPKVLTYNYEKPFPVTITVGSTDSIKLFDVIITSKIINKL